MGQYAEISISATFDTVETAKKVCTDLNKNVAEFVAKRAKDKDFYLQIEGADQNEEYVNISLNSGRSQNAEWQAEQIFAYLKETYKNEMQTFDAEMFIPETIISYEIGVEEES